MFKSFFIACALLFSSAVFAQDNQIPTNEKSGEAEYSDVVNATGVSAKDLRERAYVWIDEFFPNPEGAVESDDSAAGKISGQAQFRLILTDKKGNESPAGFVRYSYTLEFKDGKYRYVIDRIHHKQASYFDISRWENKDDPNYRAETYPVYVEQAITYFDDMIDKLEVAMATPIEEESSDW